jgi:hypothetical protein
MEQLTPEVYCQRAALELVALMHHQRNPRARVRHQSSLLRRCVEEVLAAKQGGMQRDGPWIVGQRPLKRPGRGGLQFIPLAQRGKTTIMVSTLQEAEELVAFLNQCGIGELGMT